MDAAQIIARLGEAGPMPVDAIAAARADRAAAVPAFIQAIEEYVPGYDKFRPNPLYLIFHLLGEWREKSAYWPLAVLLHIGSRRRVQALQVGDASGFVRSISEVRGHGHGHRGEDADDHDDRHQFQQSKCRGRFAGQPRHLQSR